MIQKCSEELGSMYYADYRQVDDMRRLCEVLGSKVEIVDLYPPELNRWTDAQLLFYHGSHKIMFGGVL